MPRKSTDSTAAHTKGNDEGGSASKPAKESKGLSVEELNLPRSMVQRLAKGMLPLNTSIQKDALLAISKSATVFVSYLASNANDRAVLNNKKTVQPIDVYAALNELEFPGFVDRVMQELELYNKEQCDKRNTYRKRIRQQNPSGDGQAEGQAKTEDMSEAGDQEGGIRLNGSEESSGGAAQLNGGSRREGEPSASKKARMSSSAVHADDDHVLNGDNDEDGDTIDENEGEDQDQDDGEGGEGEDDDDDPDEEEDPPDDEDQENGLEEPPGEQSDDEEDEDSPSD